MIDITVEEKEICINRGIKFTQYGDYGAALAELDKAIETDPNRCQNFRNSQ